LEKLANLFKRKTIKNPDALVVKILWSREDINVEISGFALVLQNAGWIMM